MYKCLENVRQTSSEIWESELTAITIGIPHLDKIWPISSEWQAETKANLIPWSASPPKRSCRRLSLNLSDSPFPTPSNYK